MSRVNDTVNTFKYIRTCSGPAPNGTLYIVVGISKYFRILRTLLLILFFIITMIINAYVLNTWRSETQRRMWSIDCTYREICVTLGWLGDPSITLRCLALQKRRRRKKKKKEKEEKKEKKTESYLLYESSAISEIARCLFSYGYTVYFRNQATNFESVRTIPLDKKCALCNYEERILS